MRLWLTILALCGTLYAGDWDAHMQAYCEKEWAAIPDSNRSVIWEAYDWGAERDFREMGAIYAVESRGDMSSVRIEFNGDESVGPGQNLVRYVAIRTYGEGFTPLHLAESKHALQTNLECSLNQSWVQISRGFKKFDTRWEVWKYYNGQNAPHERYPARVQAWLRFLDNKRRK